MKNFFLLAFSLLCFNTFAQDKPIDPNDPSSDYTYSAYATIYGCDSDGNNITDPNSVNYVEYGIEYLVYVGTGNSSFYTTPLHEIENILCQNGNLNLLPIGVKVLWKVEKGIRTDYTIKLPIKPRL